jgi:hypothetical protein
MLKGKRLAQIRTVVKRQYIMGRNYILAIDPELFITKTKMNKRLSKSILSGSIALHLQGDFLNRGKPN